MTPDPGSSVNFNPPLTNFYPAVSPVDPGFQSVQPVSPVQNMDPNFDPAKVPDDQLIVGRQPRTLSAIEWLGEAVKNGFASMIRTFKMMGILFSIWWNGASVDSIEKAAAKSQGGILVKAIQFACSSPEIAKDMFGDDHQKFIDALSHVTTSNKPMTKGELEHCLKEAGIPYDPSKLDERVNLGTGSIGEVNEIIMQGGGRQVVKVVSPSSETRVYSDLKVLRFALGLISFFKPSVLGAGTKHAVYEFFDSVKEELNLVNEAQRTQKQQYAFQAINNKNLYNIRQNELPPCAVLLPTQEIGMAIPDPHTGQDLVRLPVNYKVPNVSGEHATPRTLSMDKVDGVTLSEKDQGKLRDILAQLFGSAVDMSLITDDHLKIFRFYLKNLAFQHWAYCYSQTGFFNADMHDGNVMVAVENGELCIYFIDLGNAQRVSRDTVKATYTILGAMEALRDAGDESQRERYADIIINNLQVMGDYKPEKANWAKLKQDVKALMAAGTSGPIEKKVIDLFNLAYPCHVKIPKEIVALFRAKLLIDTQRDLTTADKAAWDRVITSLVNIYQSAAPSMMGAAVPLPVPPPSAFPPYHCGAGQSNIYVPPPMPVYA